MSIPPPDHAAAIISHYLRALTERASLRWTERNDRDMDTLADLLTGAAPELDEIPPYERPIVSDRQTIVLERDPVTAAADEARAGRWRYAEEDDARRILRREDGRR